MRPTDAPMPVKPRMTYKQKVLDFLAENKDLPVIQKIVRMEQLTGDDIVSLERILWSELGTKEDYQAYIESGNLLCGDHVAIFIRSIVGVDRQLALQKFSSFIADASLNSMQEEYLKTIIAYVCSNGDITPQVLLSESPFVEYSIIELFGEKSQGVARYVEALHRMVVRG